MSEIGKILIALGALLLVGGILLVLLGRWHVPVGHLPGDVVYRRKNFVFYFPLGTSILLSILLTLVFFLLSRFHR